MQLWIADGATRGKAKEYQNMRHPPLVKGADDQLVLTLFPPPELHLLLGNYPSQKYFYISSQNTYTGVVDKVVTEMMRNVFQTDKEGKQFMAAFYKQVRMIYK